MTYEESLNWVKENREKIIKDAERGSYRANNLISIHRMLVNHADAPTAVLFVQTIEDYIANTNLHSKIIVYTARHKETGKFPYNREVGFREKKRVLRDTPARVYATYNHASNGQGGRNDDFEIVKYEMVEIHDE